MYLNGKDKMWPIARRLSGPLNLTLRRFLHLSHRFWWRDTRLSELAQFYPPHKSRAESSQHRFSYPTTLLPIPYHTDTSCSNLIAHIIPVARTPRTVDVQVPVDIDVEIAEDGMDMRGDGVQQLNVNLDPDGLLLYVSEASYESGTSPLSSWIPITAAQTDQASPLDLFLRLVNLFIS